VPRSRSKRSSYRPPQRPNPKASPKWLAPLGLGLILVGIVQVLLMYIVGLPGAGLNLVIGFGLMAGGLVALSRYR
jgi:hypothetical protein